jgi:hypothetical protein
MADTYGVTAQSIADELSNLMPDGFGVGTKPSQGTVEGFISDADAIVTLHVARATGVTPSPADESARLARRYIIDATKAEVIGVVYLGNDPRDIAAARGPFDKLASDMLARIDAEPVRTVTPEALSWASAPSGTTQHTSSW